MSFFTEKDWHEERLLIEDDDGFFWNLCKKNWFSSKNKIFLNEPQWSEIKSIISQGSLFNPEKFLILDLRKLKTDKLKALFKNNIASHVKVLGRLPKGKFSPPDYQVKRFPKPVKFAEKSKLIKSLVSFQGLKAASGLDSLLNDFDITNPSRVAMLLEAWKLQFPNETEVKVAQIRGICYGQGRKSVFFDVAREFEKPANRRNKRLLESFIEQQENVLGLVGFLFNRLGRGERLAISLDKLIKLEADLKMGKPEYLVFASFFMESAK